MILNNEFYCSRCGRYKPAAAKCSTLLCCSNCKSRVLAADVSDKTESVEKKRVLSRALKLKMKFDAKMYEQKMNSINDDNWMEL